MRLLLIESKKSSIYQIKLQLQNRFIIDIARDFKRAILLANTNNYQLVMIDLCYNLHQGLNLIKNFRNDQLIFPILAIGPTQASCDLAQALNTGADDYLLIPFTWEILTAHITALLRRGPITMDNKIRVGRLSFNLSTNSFVFNKKPLLLRKKGKLILGCLMRNARRIVTRPILAACAWEDQYVDRSKIDVQICQLRKSLKKQTGLDFIETKHGFGYQLSEKICHSCHHLDKSFKDSSRIALP